MSGIVDGVSRVTACSGMLRSRLGAALLVWLAATSVGSAAETDAGARALLDGIKAFRTGDVAGAIARWSESDAAYAAERDSAGRLAALLRRAEAYQLQGFLGRSAADLGTCRMLIEPAGKVRPDSTLEQLCQPLAINRGDDGTLPILAGMLGRTCGSLGERGRAIALLQQSLMLAEAQARWDLVAATRIDLGNVHMAEGDYAAAEFQFEQAIWGAPADDELAATAAINAARAHAGAIRAIDAEGADKLPALRADHLAAAERWLSSAQERMPAAGEDSPVALSLAYAAALLEVHELAPTRPAERAGRIRQSLENIVGAERTRLKASEKPAVGDPHWRHLSLALGYLGHLFEVEGDRARALDLTREALLAAQQQEDELLPYRWYWQSGRLQQGFRQRDSAIDDYKRAQTHLKAVRPDLLAAYGGFGGPFRQAVSPFYLELADLLLTRAETKDDSASQPDLLAARDVVEQLKAAELEDYFQDDCVASLQERVTGIDDLAEDTAAIYPILLPDRIVLVIAVQGNLRQVPADELAPKDLAGAVRMFRNDVQARRTRDYKNSGARLYNALIRPFAADLKNLGVTTLVIVPDGPLRTIPLSALYDKDHDQFLIEQFAVAVAPGLELLDPRRMEPGVAVLLGALSESVQGFAPLNQVSEEVEAFQELFEVDLFQDARFTDAAVKEALQSRPYSIVHMATHGVFEDNPEDSYILTYDGRLTMNELDEFVRSSEFRDEPVELLGLSACETAEGNERAALGLAGVGVKAGARSVFATLWTVQDDAAARLVGLFYARLSQGLSKAVALQDAQRAFIRERSTRHPGLWSPFILIGSWL